MLFVAYTAVLALVGWALHTSASVHHGVLLPNNSKDALIVGLSLVVLGTVLAAIARDQLLHSFFFCNQAPAEQRICWRLITEEKGPDGAKRSERRAINGENYNCRFSRLLRQTYPTVLG